MKQDQSAGGAATKSGLESISPLAERRRGLRSRCVPRQADEADMVDEAHRTIPAERVPTTSSANGQGVDPEIWLDHVRYARLRDPLALERLVLEYRAFARSLARRLRRDGEQGDDLSQVAMEALVVALGRFDPARGVPFVAYAGPTILGTLRHHHRDRGWLVRIPRTAHELITAAHRASSELTSKLGRVPSDKEVADWLGVVVEELLEAQAATSVREVVSLDATPNGAGHGASVVAAADPGYDRAENHVALVRAMALLADDERDLLRRYYFAQQTQAQIGETLGLSQMEVSRRLARLVSRLRARIQPG